MSIYAYNYNGFGNYKLTNILNEFIDPDIVAYFSSSTATRITESENKVTVEIELPGVKKEDITAKVHKKQLTVKTKALKEDSNTLLTANRELDLRLQLPYEVNKNYKATVTLNLTLY